MLRSYAFNGPNAQHDAAAFVGTILEAGTIPQAPRNRGFTPINAATARGGIAQGTILSNTVLDVLAQTNGGNPFFNAESSDQRETNLYDYKRTIHPQDRWYLAERDPTGIAVIHKMPNMLWRRFPTITAGIGTGLSTSSAEAFNNYFALLRKLGYLNAARQAHKMARRDGGAFVYRVAPGNLDEPLPRDTRIRGYRTIPLHAIPIEGVLMHPNPDGVPLIEQHGIASLLVRGTRTVNRPSDAQDSDALLNNAAQFREVEVHGTRLEYFAPTEDHDKRNIVHASILDAIHDDLWNFRDILATTTRGIIQGNPIVADVNIKDGFSLQVPADIQGTDEDPITVLQDEMEDYQGFGRDSFSPIEGITLRRVGAAEVEVPPDLVRALVGRIAGAAGLPVGKIFPTSRGSEQVTDQDQADMAGFMHELGDNYAHAHLQHQVDVGRYTRMLRGTNRSELPANLVWPDPLFYNARERVFVAKSAASAAFQVAQLGRDLPPEYEALIPRNGRPIFKPGVGTLEDQIELKNGAASASSTEQNANSDGA